MGIQMKWIIAGIPLLSFIPTLIKHSHKTLTFINFKTFVDFINIDVIFSVLTIVAYTCFDLEDLGLMYVFTFNVSKLTIICQLCYVMEKPFRPARLLQLAQLVLFAINLILLVLGQGCKSLRLLSALLAFVDFAWFVSLLSRRIADMLGIHVFRVKSSAKEGKDK